MSTLALIGLPNSGKSSLFNLLTDKKQKVANFPGITVDKKAGHLEVEGSRFEIIDLPGVYTLEANTLDEKVTRDFVFGKVSDSTDGFILVIDSTNIKKSLYLALQLKELNQKFLVALNMSDLSERRGQKIDLKKLSNALGEVPVIPTTALNREGIGELKATLNNYFKGEKKESSYTQDYPSKIKDVVYIQEKIKEVEAVLQDVTIEKIAPDSLTEKIDKIVLHPVMGLVVLLSVLVFTFQLLFAWADPFVGYIETLFEMLGGFLGGALPDGLFKSLIIDGILAGVGGIVVFLPHIIFLFVLINLLEGSGYLARSAFLLDFLMRKFGLPGKAVVPLLSSHACAIPGIMSARIIKDRRQRLVTMMISPLMACSARLPVYTLLIGIMIPNETVLGFLGLPGLVMLGLYLFGIVTALVISLVSSKRSKGQNAYTLMMELPSYKVPNFKEVILGAIDKGVLFLKKAGTIIVVLSMIIWALVTFPGAPENADKPEIHYSAAATVGRTFEPIFRPLGFDWKITTALIPSFGARELLVSAMGTVMAVNESEENEDAYAGKLSTLLQNEYSFATLMALLIWFVFSPQCISTFGVLRKETGGYKLPIIFGVYTLVLAYIASWVTYLVLS